MNLCVFVFATIPYCHAIFSQYFGVDTLTVICTHVYPCQGRVRYLVYAMPVTYIIATIEQMRLFPLIMCICTIVVHIVLGILSHLRESRLRISMSRVKSMQCLRKYYYLQIILQTMYDLSAPVIAALMTIGLLLSVTFNFLCVKMRSVLPMPYYLVCFVAAGIILVLIQILLPLAINVYEDSEALMQIWKVALRYSCDRKYLRRRLRACKAVRFYAGLFKYNFFYISLSTKSTFWYAIVDYTITALLST